MKIKRMALISVIFFVGFLLQKVHGCELDASIVTRDQLYLLISGEANKKFVIRCNQPNLDSFLALLAERKGCSADILLLNPEDQNLSVVTLEMLEKLVQQKSSSCQGCDNLVGYFSDVISIGVEFFCVIGDILVVVGANIVEHVYKLLSDADVIFCMHDNNGGSNE